MLRVYGHPNFGQAIPDSVSDAEIEKFFDADTSVLDNKRSPSLNPSIVQKSSDERDPVEEFIRKGSLNSVKAMLAGSFKIKAEYFNTVIEKADDVKMISFLTDSGMKVNEEMVINAIDKKRRNIYTFLFIKKQFPLSAQILNRIIDAGDEEFALDIVRQIKIYLNSAFSGGIEINSKMLSSAIRMRMRDLSFSVMSCGITPSVLDLRKMLSIDDQLFQAGFDKFCVTVDPNDMDVKNECLNLFSDIIATGHSSSAGHILAYLGARLPVNEDCISKLHELTLPWKHKILDRLYSTYTKTLEEHLEMNPVWICNHEWIKERLSRGLDFPRVNEEYVVTSHIINIPFNETLKRSQYFQQIRSYRQTYANMFRNQIYENTNICPDVIGVIVQYIFVLS
jgi:hypothetical protein